ncbi:MAG TPA: sulfite exporter TauE/SafE family protein [Gemmatimonadales bacterium]|nr:sulfite exporter TauE/SafE family protein [Gemmatimonadales bacterium]
MTHLVGIAAFILVGLSLGLLGGGGSILGVPVLVYLLAVPAGVAVPMSLPVVGLASAVGAVARWRKGQLRVRLALSFAAVAMLASFAAARLGAGIPDRPRLLMFTTVMLIAAVLMWRRSMRQEGPAGPVAGGASPAPTSTPVTLALAALVVGTLTGLVGVGGGFLIVPALTGVLAIPMAEATATSLAVIALNTVAASAGWWGQVSIDHRLTALVTAAALAGMAVGLRLAPRFSARSLARIFSGLLVVVGIVMLLKL